jgi:membrane protease YdiL (CAAX protease family)
MTKLAKNHPLLSFIVLTFLIAWIPGIPHFRGTAGQFLEMAFWVGTSAPGIAFLILSRILSPRDTDQKHRYTPLIFLISWGISSAVVYYVTVVLGRVSFSGLTELLIIIECLLMGLIPALFLSSAFSNNPHVRKYFNTLVKPEGPVGYYLFAFFLPVLVLLISLPFDQDIRTGFDLIDFPSTPIHIILSMIIILIFYFLLDGGFNEESGWSGFALPRLQESYSPLLASVVLGLIWGAWHIPKYVVIISESELGLSIWLVLLLVLHQIRLIFFRIIMTWLFNKTNGGMITPMILHASHNLIRSWPISEICVYGICAVYMIVSSRMWQKCPSKELGSMSPRG